MDDLSNDASHLLQGILLGEVEAALNSPEVKELEHKGYLNAIENGGYQLVAFLNPQAMEKGKQ